MTPSRRTYSVRLQTPDGQVHHLEVGDDEYVLEAALREGIDLPYSCLQGWCLSCACRILEGSLDQEDSKRYFTADREAGFALICSGKPESDLVLETHATPKMRQARQARGLPFPKGDWGKR